MIDAFLIILFAFLSFCYIYRQSLLLAQKCYNDEIIKKITPSYKILTVKNNEDCIEGVINSLIKEMHTGQSSIQKPKIIVIDFGSSDTTLKIVEKLSYKYDFIQILHSDSYINMVSST